MLYNQHVIVIIGEFCVLSGCTRSKGISWSAASFCISAVKRWLPNTACASLKRVGFCDQTKTPVRTESVREKVRDLARTM